MNLKSLANSYTAFDGAAVFHMLPFDTLEMERYRKELGRISPQFVYTHKVTGEQRPDEPPEFRSAVQAATNARKLRQTQMLAEAVDGQLNTEQIVELFTLEQDMLDQTCAWVREDRWNIAENTFVALVPDTVEIEFPLGKDAPKEVQALEMFWKHRNGSIEKAWSLFQQTLSARALNQWWEAYSATRDTTMASDAPPEPAVAADPSP